MSLIRMFAPCHQLAALTLAFIALVAAGCSPAYNWRELRPDGASLLALFPCKPDEAERAVPLSRAMASTLHMYSCNAGDQTYALAWASLPEGADAKAALEAWAQASSKSLHAEAVDGQGREDSAAGWSFELASASTVQTMQTKGRDHLGADIQAQVAYFAMGTKVYQAAVYGKELPDKAVEPFFSGLKLLP